MFLFAYGDLGDVPNSCAIRVVQIWHLFLSGVYLEVFSNIGVTFIRDWNAIWIHLFNIENIHLFRGVYAVSDIGFRLIC